MDGLDRLSIEEFINNPAQCIALIMLRECFKFGVPEKCPWKILLEMEYDKKEEEEQDRESGLIG